MCVMETDTMKQEAPGVPHLYSWLLASVQMAEGMHSHVSRLFSASMDVLIYKSDGEAMLVLLTPQGSLRLTRKQVQTGDEN